MALGSIPLTDEIGTVPHELDHLHDGKSWTLALLLSKPGNP